MFSTPKKSKIPQYRSSPRTPIVKDKSCSTPLKLLLPKCVVCAKSVGGHYTLLHSSTGVKKGLSQLLLKYGGVNVTQGMICSPDQEKLLNLEKRVASFREQCQETIKVISRSGGAKRCVVTPGKSPSRSSGKKVIVDDSVDGKTSKKQLFPSNVKSTSSSSHSQGIMSWSGDIA